jgi:RNase adaptor protein for sRNA GlmZ degradation
MNAPVQLVSFGYLHDAPPVADVVFDARRRYHDPHFNLSLRELTAEDPRVAAAVMATLGVQILVEAVVALAHGYRRGPDRGPVVIAVGCSGGRHRAPSIAAEVARRLENQGVPVALAHRDIGRPVVRWALSEVA